MVGDVMDSIDPLTWRFQLRRDVVFSDGTPFNADAVVAVTELLTGPAAVREIVARMMSFLDSARAIFGFSDSHVRLSGSKSCSQSEWK